MYLILDKDNVWQATTNTLEKAKELINDIKKFDKKIWNKTFEYKIVKEIEI